VTLDESLALTALVVQKAPERRSRFTIRWLRRLLEEDELLSIEDAALAASALAALATRSHEQAVSTLSAMAERATRQAERREVESGGGVIRGSHRCVVARRVRQRYSSISSRNSS
jgi:hypothetical protein